MARRGTVSVKRTTWAKKMTNWAKERTNWAKEMTVLAVGWSSSESPMIQTLIPWTRALDPHAQICRDVLV